MKTNTIAEQRIHQRYHVLIEGKIIIAGLPLAIDVTVVDMSPGGARLKTEADFDFPETFELAIATEEFLYPCQQSWRGGEFMGVEFSGAPSGINPWYSAERAIISDSLATGQDPHGTGKAGGLAMIDVKQAVRIEPSFKLHFARNPANIHRGTCSVHVLLHNRENIAAHHPFFCVPGLKINAQAAPGWEQSDFVSVLKMRRFAAVRENVLEHGAIMHCCTIALTFKELFGGRIEYETGSEHPLDDLPDFKLTCIAGAGNFPVERLVFTVPAASIRATITEELVRHPILMAVK
jgi:hypothetical protein